MHRQIQGITCILHKIAGYVFLRCSNTSSWKKVQEYLPEKSRLTESCLPDEYFVGIGRFGIHIDHYRVKEPKTRIILFHGVGEGM